MYGRRNALGTTLIRFAAIVAAALFIAGLLNRPGGTWSPSVDITPAHAAHTAGPATPGR